jgi:hypothetical protein
MKTKYKIRILLSLFLIIFAGNVVYSQGTVINRNDKPGVFIGIILIPGQSQIINDGVISGTQLTSIKMGSFSASMEAGYFFSNLIGVSSGIGFTSYKTQLSLGTYQNKFTTTDTENETYERRIIGTDISETQNVSTISIPVCFNFNIPVTGKIAIFVQPGLNLSLPLGKNYKSSGIFTYKGYYTIDNVLLENLPDFGFPSNLNSSAEGKLEIKSLVFSIISLVGIEYKIQEKIRVSLGASYNKTLSNISQYSSPDNFQLSSDANQINSLMGGSTKASASSIGLRIGVRYYLK